MALARLSCGGCGAVLSGREAACPRCGEAIVFPAGGEGGAAAEGRVCPVCGQRSRGTGAYCESCGVSLAGGASVAAGGVRRPGGGRPQRWKIAAGVVVALLLALFGYLEFNRPAAPPQQPGRDAEAVAQPPMEEVRRLQETVRTNPGDAAAVLQLANRLHDLGLQEPSLLNGAIDAYRHYLGLKPGDANARVDLGICYFELGRNDSASGPRLFREAVGEMKAAIAAEPNHQPAAFNLGVVHLFMGDTEESTTWFRKAVAIAPESDLGKRAKNLLEQHAFPSSAR